MKTKETAPIKSLPNEPEPFTARWHAYELGRIAWRVGEAQGSPFDEPYGPLTEAWNRGFEDERSAQRQERQAIAEHD